jgi:hypothetical protein
VTALTQRPIEALPSERVALGRLARNAALRVPGVMRTDAGPDGRWITAGGGERIEGVTCTAATDGGYEVSLRLVCAIVPLPRLADQVRRAVAADAARRRIAVAKVCVHVADLVAAELL